MIKLAIPEPEESFTLTAVDADVEPTGEGIPRFVETKAKAMLRDGCVPGSFALLWDEVTRKALSIDWGGEDEDLPLDLEALWTKAGGL